MSKNENLYLNSPAKSTRSRKTALNTFTFTTKASTTPKKPTRRVIKTLSSSSSELSETEISPRKHKDNSTTLEPSTPPKLRKLNSEVATTPSKLLNRLSLISPSKCKEENITSTNKNKTTLHNAKKALHCSLPSSIPGREKELDELRKFVFDHLDERKSGSMYISGSPGTGKTASLTTVLEDPRVSEKTKKVYVNCTSIKSSGAIFARIIEELNIKTTGRTEKDKIQDIENYLNKTQKMILLVLDEIDQLESKKQSILYTIFEWPAKPNSKTILIGIANALDLTDRILPRLQARCELKPKLMHFASYTKEQIVHILTDRLKEAGTIEVFNPVALQMIAGKVSAVSGDIRRALDIARRAIELVEQDKHQEVLRSIDNITNVADDIKLIEEKKPTVELKQVVSVLNNVYGTSNNLNDDSDDSFPLQQKVVLCTLLLILKNSKNKDVTIGRLHDVYRRVCNSRNMVAVDQAEFFGLCTLIEARGIIKVSRKKEPRLNKVHLEWDQEEVNATLNDKKLLSAILQNDACLGKMTF